MGDVCNGWPPLWLYSDIEDSALASDRQARDLAIKMAITLSGEAHLPFDNEASSVVRRFVDQVIGVQIKKDRGEALSERRQRWLTRRFSAVGVLSRQQAERQGLTQITSECLENAIIADIKAVDAEREARRSAA